MYSKYRAVYYNIYMKKIFLNGVVLGAALIIGNLAISSILSFVFPTVQDMYLLDPVFRQMTDPFMNLFYLYPFLLAFPLAYVWDKSKDKFVGGYFKKAFDFGGLYFFIIAIPMFAINYGSFTFPFAMVISWVLMSAVNGYVAGFTLAKLDK